MLAKVSHGFNLQYAKTYVTTKKCGVEQLLIMIQKTVKLLKTSLNKIKYIITDAASENKKLVKDMNKKRI